MTNDQPIVEAMDLIAQYCIQQQMVPIGFRAFSVGDWTITVNGTGDEKDGLPPEDYDDDQA